MLVGFWVWALFAFSYKQTHIAHCQESCRENFCRGTNSRSNTAPTSLEHWRQIENSEAFAPELIMMPADIGLLPCSPPYEQQTSINSKLQVSEVSCLPTRWSLHSSVFHLGSWGYIGSIVCARPAGQSWRAWKSTIFFKYIALKTSHIARR